MARTTVDDAYVSVGFVTGADGFGSAHYSDDVDFDKGETFDVDQNRLFGRGTLSYSRAGGVAVAVDYSYDSQGTGCVANGVAIGG